MRAAFFDMDKTVLRVNSGTSWMRFLYGRGEISTPQMIQSLGWALLYRFSILDMETIADRMIEGISGDSESEMIEKCRIWYDKDIMHCVAPSAKRAIIEHRQKGDIVVLLTGASQYISKIIGEKLSIEHVLCTEIEVKEGVFTGRLAQKCFGDYKVPIAEEFAAKHKISLEESAFYTDSYTDIAMLNRVGLPVVVNPDPRLRRTAIRNGWRVEEWAKGPL